MIYNGNMKKLKYLPILSFIPLLFMANSPSPYQQETYGYVDFEVSNIVYGEKTPETYYDRYAITFDVNNYGDKYLNLELIFDTISGENIPLYFELRNFQYDSLIPPHTSLSLEGYLKKVSVEDIMVTGRAYEQGKPSTYKSVKLTSVTPYYSDYFTYDDGFTYDFEISGVEASDQYYYSMIVEYEYNNNHYALMAKDLESFSINIPGDTQLTESDIKITGINLWQGRDRYTDYTNEMWLVIWIVSIIILSIGFVASLIAVPIYLFTAKPWRKTLPKDESQN